MAEHLKEAHRAKPYNRMLQNRGLVPFKTMHTNTEWSLLCEAHGETFLCMVRSGVDYLPEFVGNFFSATVRCLNPAAINKFACTYSATEPGTDLGIVFTSRVGNESIDALSESGNLFRIQEAMAVGISCKQYPNNPPLKTLKGSTLNVGFKLNRL
jgi:hypothetical protein